MAGADKWLGWAAASRLGLELPDKVDQHDYADAEEMSTEEISELVVQLSCELAVWTKLLQSRAQGSSPYEYAIRRDDEIGGGDE